MMEAKLKIQESIKSWTKVNLTFAATMLILRLMFYAITSIRLRPETEIFWTIMSGVKFDVVLTGSVAMATFLPYCLVHFFAPKTARIIAGSTIILYALATSLLSEYFCIMSRPLDHILFSYSPSEVKSIVLKSTSVSFDSIANVVLSIGLTICLIWGAKKVKLHIATPVVLLLLSAWLSFGFRYRNIVRNEVGYRSHADFYLAVNQFTYSFINITDHINNDEPAPNADEITNAARQYHSLLDNFEFADTKYPFWRKADDNDVLGSFLNLTSNGQMPNFVYIVIEGFGRKLTGVDNPEVSFTPFIDSLAANGLFWKNCLSTTERTYGALPAILASAPHGKCGFANMWEPIPDHNSLLKELAANGYHTSFFYGGSPAFDGQDKFLLSNHIGYILKATPETSDSTRNTALKKNHRWGLDDGEMFDLAINHKKTETSNAPTADIYLTLSTHEPFDLPQIEKYKKLAAQRATSTNKQELKNINANLNIFACFIYTDECVRRLFDYYRSRPDFENTIFVITGDHRMYPLLNMDNILMRYNVPLIIYSPLLKRHKTMEGIVSHLDITPSTIAYLSNNYNFKTSEYCHWIGSVFDTTSNFSSKKKLAFMMDNRDLVSFLSDTLFVSSNRLFSVSKNMILRQIDNQNVRDSINHTLDNYRILSRYVANDYLIKPDKNSIATLYHINTDFNNLTDDTFKAQLTTIDGDKCLMIDSSTTFGAICPNITLTRDCHKLKVDVRFSLQSFDTSATLPKIVCEKNGEHSYYLAVPIEEQENKIKNTGNKESFVFRTTIVFEGKIDGDIFKLYLWNNHKSRMTYDNLYVNIDCVE